MSIKRFCDRCGAIINPPQSYTPITIGHTHYENSKTYELCVSCAYKLKKFLEAEEGE